MVQEKVSVKLRVLQKQMSSKNIDEHSLCGYYRELGKIANSSPQTAVNALEIFKVGLQSEKNSSNSLSYAYGVLEEVAEVNPHLIKQVFDVYKIGMQSESNYDGSLISAYRSISRIAEGHSRFAKDAKELIEFSKGLSNNTPTSLECADACECRCEQSIKDYEERSKKAQQSIGQFKILRVKKVEKE